MYMLKLLSDFSYSMYTPSMIHLSEGERRFLRNADSSESHANEIPRNLRFLYGIRRQRKQPNSKALKVPRLALLDCLVRYRI